MEDDKAYKRLFVQSRHVMRCGKLLKFHRYHLKVYPDVLELTLDYKFHTLEKLIQFEKLFWNAFKNVCTTALIIGLQLFLLQIGQRLNKVKECLDKIADRVKLQTSRNLLWEQLKKLL